MKMVLPAQTAHLRQVELGHLIDLEGDAFAHALRAAVEADIATVHPLFIALQNGSISVMGRTLALLAQALLPLALARADLTAALIVRLTSTPGDLSGFAVHRISGDATRGCGPPASSLRRLAMGLSSVVVETQKREEMLVIAQQSRDRCLRLSESERPGCALGAIAALDWHWPPVASRIRAGIVRHTQMRASYSAAFEIQPNQADALALVTQMVGTMATTPANRRALVFGASQALADRALLWDAILDLSL